VADEVELDEIVDDTANDGSRVLATKVLDGVPVSDASVPVPALVNSGCDAWPELERLNFSVRTGTPDEKRVSVGIVNSEEMTGMLISEVERTMVGSDAARELSKAEVPDGRPACELVSAPKVWVDNSAGVLAAPEVWGDTSKILVGDNSINCEELGAELAVFVFKDVPLPTLLTGGIPVLSAPELATAFVVIVSTNDAEGVKSGTPLVGSMENSKLCVKNELWVGSAPSVDSGPSELDALIPTGAVENWELDVSSADPLEASEATVLSGIDDWSAIVDKEAENSSDALGNTADDRTVETPMKVGEIDAVDTSATKLDKISLVDCGPSGKITLEGERVADVNGGADRDSAVDCSVKDVRTIPSLVEASPNDIVEDESGELPCPRVKLETIDNTEPPMTEVSAIKLIDGDDSSMKVDTTNDGPTDVASGKLLVLSSSKVLGVLIEGESVASTDELCSKALEMLIEDGTSIAELSVIEGSGKPIEVIISTTDENSNVLGNETGASIDVICAKEDCARVEMKADVTSAEEDDLTAVEKSVGRVEAEPRLLLGGIPVSTDELSSCELEEVVVKKDGWVVCGADCSKLEIVDKKRVLKLDDGVADGFPELNSVERESVEDKEVSALDGDDSWASEVSAVENEVGMEDSGVNVGKPELSNAWVEGVKALDGINEDNDRALDISGAPDDGAKLSKGEENTREDDGAASEGVSEITDGLVASNSLLVKLSTVVLREGAE
jgi:hypothetical protein